MCKFIWDNFESRTCQWITGREKTADRWFVTSAQDPLLRVGLPLCSLVVIEIKTKGKLQVKVRLRTAPWCLGIIGDGQ